LDPDFGSGVATEVTRGMAVMGVTGDGEGVIPIHSVGISPGSHVAGGLCPTIMDGALVRGSSTQAMEQLTRCLPMVRGWPCRAFGSIR
jgi:hypothetical protein